MSWQAADPSARDDAVLAPYAIRGAASRGRKFDEPPHPYRGPFQRDRDRILHCAAFRRLADKTQVFTRVDDYHRTRLTHTMEVASIARTLARGLRINEDLVEALALLHDLGHPPFGHAGEETLNRLLAEHGGFSHNAFAITLVDELERRYPGRPGLNLTWETLDSQASRTRKHDHAAWPPPLPLLEAQVVDLADGIAYNAHDVDDALQLGLVQIAELEQLPLIAACRRQVKQMYAALSADEYRRALVHRLLDSGVTDALLATRKRIEALAPASVADVRGGPWLATAGEALAAQRRQLAAFLFDRVYRHEKVIAVRRQAQQWMTEMFAALVNNPQELPPEVAERAESVGLPRAAGEYLAALTDRAFWRLT